MMRLGIMVGIPERQGDSQSEQGREDRRCEQSRGDGVEQPITTVELLFDLVYVFAVTQLSHMILSDLTIAELGRAAFLLVIV